MERLRKCLVDPARNCVRMNLLKNNAEKAIAMVEKNYGEFDKIIERLMEEVRLQIQVKDSSDFQEFYNLVENLAVTVENAFYEQHCGQKVVEETSRISAFAVGAAHDAEPVG
jgi:restriction endonuclease